MAAMVIFAGIPVNTAVNRAYAEQNGLGNLPWPVPYPSGSVIMECHRCDGLVWVGPNSRRAAARMTDARVMCLVCGILTTRGEMVMLRLSASEGNSGD